MVLVNEDGAGKIKDNYCKRVLILMALGDKEQSTQPSLGTKIERSSFYIEYL